LIIAELHQAEPCASQYVTVYGVRAKCLSCAQQNALDRVSDNGLGRWLFSVIRGLTTVFVAALYGAIMPLWTGLCVVLIHIKERF